MFLTRRVNMDANKMQTSSAADALFIALNIGWESG